jgi:hypothetical protein
MTREHDRVSGGAGPSGRYGLMDHAGRRSLGFGDGAVGGDDEAYVRGQNGIS